jgi:hypothetical protein
MSDAISTISKQLCEACGKLKMCRMYVTQMGTTAWVCVECRKGKARDSQ